VRRSLFCGVVPPCRVSLRLIREITSAVAFSVTVAAPCVSQAAAGSPDSHHRAFAVSGDAGTIPTVFGGGQCGDDGYDHTAELGLGVSAIDRPRSIVIFGAELRASTVPNVFGCKLIARGPVEVAPGIWESRPGFLASPGTPHTPLIRSVLRAGLETPSYRSAIFRATIGGGFIWSSRPAPVASGSIALSSSSAGKRAFIELEHDVTRVRQVETRFRYRQDSTVQTPLGTSVVTERIHPTWTTLRMGLELPWP
jgi:hypothetical protein